MARHRCWRAGVLLLATLALTACGLLRGSDEPPLPGERLPVLALVEETAADPALADRQVVLPAPYRNGSWPQAGGHPTHAVHHLELPASYARAWRTSAGTGSSRERRITAAPVVADGAVYAMDANSVVSAVRVDDGRRLWRRAFAPSFEEEGAIGGGLAVDRGVLYVSTAYGELVAVDAEDGADRWRTRIGVPLRGGPTVGGGRVYVLSHDNRLHAVDAASGAVLWDHVGIQEVSGLLRGASPALDVGLVLAPFSSGEIVALRPENGRLVWSDTLSGRARLTALADLSDIGLPVLDRGLAVVASYAGRTVAFDIRSGRRVWEQDIASAETPWVAGDYVFLVTVNAEAIALSRQDGRIRWVARLPRFRDPDDRRGPISWSGPVLAGDRLILGSSTGLLVTLSPYTGETLDSVSLGEGIPIAPVVADGALYVLTDRANIHAFR